MLASVAFFDVLQVNSLYTPLLPFLQHVHFATSFRHALSACQVVSASSNFPNKQAVTNQVLHSPTINIQDLPIPTQCQPPLHVLCLYGAHKADFFAIRQSTAPASVSGQHLQELGLAGRSSPAPTSPRFALPTIYVYNVCNVYNVYNVYITLQSASVPGKEEVVKACKGCGPAGKRRRQTEN